jgi:hypothetical protein
VKLSSQFSIKRGLHTAWMAGIAAAICCGFFSASALHAQPQEAANTSKPIPVKNVKAKPAQFEGTVMHANIAQITVRGKENELAVRTFTLSSQAAGKMQQTINQGGFQYGDTVKVEYDPATSTALKIKGKPSKPK